MSVVGPLGWAYPLLNLVLGVVERVRSRGVQGMVRQPVMTNLEEITWIDWKGRERKTVIHREIKA